MDKLSNDLDAGIEDPRCHQCWHDENIGYRSLRTMSNTRHQDADKKNTKKNRAFFNRHTSPWHVEFKLGNFCNLRCIMCSPYSSSSIWTEYIKNKPSYNSANIYWDPPTGEHKWWESNDFTEFCGRILPTVRFLHFSGGEPFMVPGLANMLNQVTEPKNVDLLFVTNMTMIDNTVLELIKQFKSVNFAISLEGTDQHNDYIRYGSDFTVIEKNIDRVRNLIPGQTHLIVNHTFQHTSIYSLPALIDWCHDQNFNIHFSLHGGEDYMRINSVPPADMARFKDQIEQSLTVDPDVKSYALNVIKDYQYDSELNAKFRRYTNMIDGVRGNNYNLTFDPTN